MAPFVRKEPAFALCGLNCGLCPRYRAEGPSRCPGCGGPGFADKHPTCAVATCAGKRGSFEYCFECPDYPCAKYAAPSPADSFISSARVLEDLESARRDLPAHLAGLGRRMAVLDLLLGDYNDGRSKGLYCIAANNLPLGELEALARGLEADPALAGADPKARAKAAAARIEEAAARTGVGVKLRK